MNQIQKQLVTIESRYPDITSDLQDARAFYLVGTDFSSYLRMHRTAMIEILERGGKIHFIGIEPDENALATLNYRSNSKLSRELMTEKLSHYIESMKSLFVQQNFDLKLKLLPYVSTYALLIIEKLNGEKKAYVKTYTFHGDGIMPTMCFTEKDAEWMNFWEEQFTKMWNAEGREIKF